MQIAGEIGSNSTGAVRFFEIQTSKSGASSKRPFSASIETSQTEMADTMQRPRKVAAATASEAPALIQSQACVSSTAAPMLARFCIPSFPSAVEVSQNLGRMGSAPEERRACAACEWNNLGGGASVPSNHDPLFFVCDVLHNREAFRV